MILNAALGPPWTDSDDRSQSPTFTLQTLMNKRNQKNWKKYKSQNHRISSERMIYGRIISKVDTDFKAYTICTAFIETDSKAHHSVIAANALNQFLNLEQELGVLIGSNEGRSIVLVFTGLDKCDFFQNIAAVYLFSMQISIELCCQNIVQVLSQHSASVSSIVLIEGHRRYLISCLEKASNIHILPLTDEQYVIK